MQRYHAVMCQLLAFTELLMPLHTLRLVSIPLEDEYGACRPDADVATAFVRVVGGCTDVVHRRARQSIYCTSGCDYQHESMVCNSVDVVMQPLLIHTPIAHVATGLMKLTTSTAALKANTAAGMQQQLVGAMTDVRRRAEQLVGLLNNAAALPPHRSFIPAKVHRPAVGRACVWGCNTA